MRARFAFAAAAVLVAFSATSGYGGGPKTERVKKELEGSWLCVSNLLPERFKNVKHVKHITATHYTWVTYDAKEMTVLAASGGTWTLNGDTYREKCEFASAGYDHLRGTETALTLKLEGDTLSIKGTLKNGFEIDEVWKRMKPGRK